VPDQAATTGRLNAWKRPVQIHSNSDLAIGAHLPHWFCYIEESFRAGRAAGRHLSATAFTNNGLSETPLQRHTYWR